MAKNPMAFMQLASLWASFTRRHPKFPAFLKAASQAAMQEGSIVEIQVTTPESRKRRLRDDSDHSENAEINLFNETHKKSQIQHTFHTHLTGMRPETSYFNL